jgi:hypothetical protein
MNAIKMLACALAALAICFAIQATTTARAAGWEWNYVGDPCKHRRGIQQMHPVLGPNGNHTQSDLYVACNDGSVWRNRDLSP